MKLVKIKSCAIDESFFKSGDKAIVITAHPDDETIWMGGTILTNKNIDWTIFSLCRYSDDDRRPKFKKVCSYYNAKCIMTDLEDEGKITFEEGIEDAKNYIKESLKGKKFNYIFTHGKNGEYGHDAHKQVNIAVNDLILSGDINAEYLFNFNYDKDPENEYKVIAKVNSNYIKKLDSNIFQEKKRITSEMHGYPMDGIDVGYSTNPEAFLVKIIKN